MINYASSEGRMSKVRHLIFRFRYFNASLLLVFQFLLHLGFVLILALVHIIYKIDFKILFSYQIDFLKNE